MLGRYKLYRGRRPEDDPLPEGRRMDTRKHTKHCLRPDAKAVFRYLADPGPKQWKAFEAAYLELLEGRFAERREDFDELAALARDGDVWIGCSCPTAANPDVRHCHTYLALKFMKRRYRGLKLRLPDS